VRSGCGADARERGRASHGDDLSTYGFFIPWNASGGTVGLDAIVPLALDGLEVAKAGILPPGTDAIEPGRGFPPPGLVVSRIAGSTLPPGSGPLDEVQVVVGLRGTGSVLGFLVRYHEGPASYDAVVMRGAIVCRSACGDTTAIQAEQRAFAASVVPFVRAPSR
jgi:hypothetical protein